MKRALLIHDIYNSHDQGWYNTMRLNLEFLGFKVIAPIFPFPEDCNYKSWKRVIERDLKQAGVTPSETHKFDIVISHGVGVYFAIGAISRRYISTDLNYFIAPYFPHKQNNKSYEELGLRFDNTLTEAINKNLFTENNTSVFYSNDDVYISLQAFQKLQQKIEASWYLVKNGKHFTVGDTDDIPEVRGLLEDQVRESLLTMSKKMEIVKDEFRTFDEGVSTSNKISITQNGGVEIPKKYKTPKDSFFTLRSDVNNVLDTESSIELSNYMKKEKRRTDFHKKQTIFLLEKVILVIIILLLVVGLGYVSYYIYSECCKLAPVVIEEKIVTQYVYVKNSTELSRVLLTSGDKKIYVSQVDLKNFDKAGFGSVLMPLQKYIEPDSGMILHRSNDNVIVTLHILTPISANLASKDLLNIIGRLFSIKKFKKNVINEKGRIIERYSHETRKELIKRTPTLASETSEVKINDVKQWVHEIIFVLDVELVASETLSVSIPLRFLEAVSLGK